MKLETLALLFTLITFAENASAAKVFALDISRSGFSATQLRRRDSNTKTITEALQNNGAGVTYTANVTVGTPPQTLSLAIDTGSTDVWIMSSNANLCLNQSLQEQRTFNANKSSTIETVGAGGFKIQYQDHSGASGDYITDVFSIGGGSIKGLQMGLAFNSTSPSGVIGLGYDTHEASKTPYPSLIDQLVSQSLINTKAYSLYLNDLSSSSGSILFGGIDTEKFIGSLASLALVPDYSLATASSPGGIVISFTVVLSSVSVTGQAGNTTSFPLSSTATDGSTVDAIAILLDSGSALTYLPSAVVKGIYSILGVVVAGDKSGNVYVDCGLRTSAKDLTINYQFSNSSGPVIKVGISELIFDLSAYGPTAGHASSLTGLPFRNTCIFGIYDASANGGAPILGDTFLRSAYVIHDLSNNLVAIAQTNFNSTGSNIVELTASASGIPVLTGVAGSATASGTATSPSGSSVGGSTSTDQAGTTATAVPSSSGASSGTGSGAASSQTSKAAAMTSNPPPLELGGLLVMAISAVFSVLGAGWFVA